MNTLMQCFYGLFKREEGQTMPEYGLIVALVSVAAIVILTALGVNLIAVFQAIVTAIAVAAPAV